jgi:hypothetical protein
VRDQFKVQLQEWEDRTNSGATAKRKDSSDGSILWYVVPSAVGWWPGRCRATGQLGSCACQPAAAGSHLPCGQLHPVAQRLLQHMEKMSVIY